MSKSVGFSFAVATRNPTQTFLIFKWLEDVRVAVEYAVGEVNERSQFDVDYILIREGTNGAYDPVIWDSRQHMTPPEPVKYWIGQRVVIDGCEIATVIPHPDGDKARQIDLDTEVWVRRESGMKQYRSPGNVRPLPNGQF
jgi:hypothetical protein